MEYIFLGLDSLVVSALYYYYKKKTNVLFQVQNAPELNLSSVKQLPDSLEYVMVSGRVDPDSNYLMSNFNENYRGPIRILEIREHSTKLNSAAGRSSTRLISRVVNEVPFSIIPDENSQIKIRVENPLKADYIFENLDLTYKKFEPSQDSTFYKLFSTLVSRESALGIETTEHMLTHNKEIIGFGKFEAMQSSYFSFNKKPQFRLTRPLNGEPFIVTTMAKASLIERLRTVTKMLKISLIIFGSIGAGLMAYCLYKNLGEYLAKKRREQQLNLAKLERLKNRRTRAQNYDNESVTDLNSNTDDNQQLQQTAATCVICLTNPRELVLLDCGHVCLCMDCLEMMNNDYCPICRTKYRTFAPIYFP